MAEALPLPPRRSTVAQFVEEYLPELWEALAAGATWPPVGYRLDADVDGERGSLHFRDGAFHAGPGDHASALVTLSADGNAWQLLCRDVLPRVLKATNRRLSEARADVASYASGTSLRPEEIASQAGTLTIDFTDDAGDRGVYNLAIGAGTGPKARLVAQDADLWALLEARGRLTPLLKSRMQLEGDVGWVLRLATRLERP